MRLGTLGQVLLLRDRQRDQLARGAFELPVRWIQCQPFAQPKPRFAKSRKPKAGFGQRGENPPLALAPDIPPLLRERRKLGNDPLPDRASLVDVASRISR